MIVEGQVVDLSTLSVGQTFQQMSDGKACMVVGLDGSINANVAAGWVPYVILATGNVVSQPGSTDVIPNEFKSVAV